MACLRKVRGKYIRDLGSLVMVDKTPKNACQPENEKTYRNREIERRQKVGFLECDHYGCLLFTRSSFLDVD